MGLLQLTQPAVEPIDLATAKQHLRVETDDDDTLIQALITACRQRIEGYTGRALITQQWSYILDMPDNRQRIPLPPLQRVDSIVVIDTNGAESTLDPATYIVDRSGIYGRVTPTKASRLAFVDPDLWRGIWPWHRGFASFVINFTCGYGDTAADVPAVLRQAILLYMGQVYENREGQPTDTNSTLARSLQVAVGADLPPTVRDLLSLYRASVL